MWSNYPRCAKCLDDVCFCLLFTLFNSLWITRATEVHNSTVLRCAYFGITPYHSIRVVQEDRVLEYISNLGVLDYFTLQGLRGVTITIFIEDTEPGLKLSSDNLRLPS